MNDCEVRSTFRTLADVSVIVNAGMGNSKLPVLKGERLTCP